ncbi:hypothetical protein LX36DRAFT_452848 [Colletotrichum falcatum]|nr:hypothetical protein LX36DRAFT_452848 [Colletotrichum falcatum]
MLPRRANIMQVMEGRQGSWVIGDHHVRCLSGPLEPQSKRAYIRIHHRRTYMPRPSNNSLGHLPAKPRTNYTHLLAGSVWPATRKTPRGEPISIGMVAMRVQDAGCRMPPSSPKAAMAGFLNQFEGGEPSMQWSPRRNVVAAKPHITNTRKQATAETQSQSRTCCAYPWARRLQRFSHAPRGCRICGYLRYLPTSLHLLSTRD